MMTANDAFHLERFVAAQDHVYADVIAELRAGRKTSHWMWFVFPQIAGLGRSAISRRYAIASLDEARAYLQHAILRTRLLECVAVVNTIEGHSAEQIFGAIDAMKFRSSLTLFELADAGIASFAFALEKFYASRRDAECERIARVL